MLTVEELKEVKQYVLRELPQILEQDPQFVFFIEGIVNEKFPRRDEFARLLDEFTEMRAESRAHFAETKERFGQMDQQFKQVDQQFKQVDQQFKQVDQRFDQIDRRFEQVDQRFEQVDQRFEQVDQRFDRVEHEVQSVREDLTKRIDAVESNLTHQMTDLRTDLTQQMRDLRSWVQVIAGGLQNRAGKNLEEVVAGAFRLGLDRPDIQPEQIRLRQKIADPTGLVFKAGKEKEVDLIAQDGELLVFEVKSAPKVEDVDDFADKVELVRLQNPAKRVNGVFVAVGGDREVRRECTRRGIQCIPSDKKASKKRKTP